MQKPKEPEVAPEVELPVMPNPLSFDTDEALPVGIGSILQANL